MTWIIGHGSCHYFSHWFSGSKGHSWVTQPQLLGHIGHKSLNWNTPRLTPLQTVIPGTKAYSSNCGLNISQSHCVVFLFYSLFGPGRRVPTPKATVVVVLIVVTSSLKPSCIALVRTAYKCPKIPKAQAPLGLHGHRLRTCCTTTPPTDTTNGQVHNNSTTNLPHRNVRAQHLDMSRCWDVANFCPLVVRLLYNNKL